MSHKERSVVIGLLFVAGTLAVMALLLPDVGSRDASPRLVCSNNLKQLGIAMQAYHNAFGSFPPAYVADEHGKPLHSWRVLALPGIEQVGVYDRYDFTSAWNSQGNAALADAVGLIRAYQCPTEVADRRTPQPWTSYLAIVGPHTAFPEDRVTTMNDFTDGLANTLLLVESHNTGIHWMEPRDLHVGQMAPTINGTGQGISSPHEGGANVLRADGGSRFLSSNTDPTVLRQLRERDDGEVISDF